METPRIILKKIVNNMHSKNLKPYNVVGIEIFKRYLPCKGRNDLLKSSNQR